MSSSIGSLALGIVGAVIGAPFGLSAVGFAVGSSIGGAVFAPDGPTMEGPRLGDTSVTASSLGETIPEQYGVTRTSGNIIWSGGLKEIKKKEESGGKGGGGGSTTITYEYYASFALALGKGWAKQIRKIWADGKLIYDGTEASGISENGPFGRGAGAPGGLQKGETGGSKGGGGGADGTGYKWVLRYGGDNQSVDNLIRESINRRLSGMPDVNEGNTGNGNQSEYATINDLITQAQAGSDGRSQFYAQRLSEIKAAAESSGSSIPDYGFTPAYRGIAYLRFRDMPLKDFGNRIPNITCEVVWESAFSDAGKAGSDDVPPTGRIVPTMGPAPTPDGLMATSIEYGGLLAHSGNTVRRFTPTPLSEDRRVEIDPVGTRTRGSLIAGSEGEREPDQITYGAEIDRALAVGSRGTALAIGTRNAPAAGFFGGTTVTNSLISIDPLTAQVKGGTDESFNVDWASPLFIEGEYPRERTRPRAGSEGWLFGESQSQVPVGEHFAIIDGNNIGAIRLVGGRNTAYKSATIPNRGGNFPYTAPLAAGEGEKGVGVTYVPRFSGSGLWLGKYTIRDNVILSGYYFAGNLIIELSDESQVSNPFSAPIDYVSATIFERGADVVMLVVALSGGGAGIVRYDEQLGVSWSMEIPDVVPPLPESGLSRSDTSNHTLVFASGRDLVVIDLGGGTYKVWEGTLDFPASNKAQVYIARIAAFLVWINDEPKFFRVGTVAGTSRGHDLASLLPDVVTDICRRSGLEPDEVDVSNIPLTPVRGYSIARPSTGRKSLEPLMQAFFFEGAESDWSIKFSDRSSLPIRTIHEDELGGIDGPTGDINWMESRVPEHAIPGQVNLNFADPLRDYQSSSAHKRRISNPIPAMFSNNVKNIELPIVLKDFEASAVAERMLFQSWMSRDSSKGVLGWTHADLDPNDVIEVEFRDGRKVQDRIGKTTLGANFEIEIETQRSGDPVFVSSPQTTIPSSAIPSVSKPIPVPSKMFAVDMPLLYDYHEIGRAAARYYTGVGAESPQWTSASIFRSPDGEGYSVDRAVDMDITWGMVNHTLQPPRSLWSTDTENTIQVTLPNDRGDVSSVTRDQIVEGANLALIYNKGSGIGEVIQFQSVSIDEDSNVYTLSNLIRGRRGTDYAVSQHAPGAIFLLLKETRFQVGEFELSRLGSSAYLKAVSTGNVISSAEAERILLRGLSLFPYAPSRVRRNFAGGDLTVSWNRRTRVGGGWDMFNNVETVPVSEDFEAYELYLLPPTGAGIRDFDPSHSGSYLAKVETSSPSHTFTAAELASYGITEADPVNVGVYQISAQVGRGFPTTISLAP